MHRPITPHMETIEIEAHATVIPHTAVSYYEVMFKTKQSRELVVATQFD